MPSGAVADCATHHLLATYVPTGVSRPGKTTSQRKPQKAMTMTAAQFAARRHAHDRSLKQVRITEYRTSAVENRPTL